MGFGVVFGGDMVVFLLFIGLFLFILFHFLPLLLNLLFSLLVISLRFNVLFTEELVILFVVDHGVVFLQT